MPTVEKIIEKMKSQPNGISFAYLTKVLNAYGYEIIRQKGSHCFFQNKKNEKGFTIPKDSVVKAIYVKMVLEIVSGGKNAKQ